MVIGRFWLVLILLVFVGEGSSFAQEIATRPVKTIVILPAPESVSRRYPAVLEPKEVVELSFEVGGALGPVGVEIGQSVSEGDVLVSLDKDPLQYEVERAAASLSEARAANENAQANLERQQQLFERGTITKVALDASQTQADQANARETSANAAFETANRNLSMSELKAPFDGTINSVNVASFGNITPGRVVLTMFPTGDFEVSLLVSFEVLGDLSLGMDVKVRPADRLNEVLAGKISEIGQRAEAVSAFPVTVALTEAPTYLRAGMAVEVELDLPVSAQASFAIPVAALALGEIEHLSKVASDGSERKARVFVFNPENSTVGAQDIVIAGISGSNLIVTDGVSPGERIVAAGAALLFDGQAVTLWRGGN